jgi:transposase InsO family protein
VRWPFDDMGVRRVSLLAVDLEFPILWRIRDEGNVAWRLMSDLRCLRMKDLPARSASPDRHDREAVWSRWRANGDRGESSTQAATDRPASCSPAAPNLTLSDRLLYSLWSVDLFRCESIVLRSYWVLVVMDQFTRRLVGVGVELSAVSGADLCRMFNAAIHGRGAPRHLSTDHDPLFEAHRWTANLRILEIDEIKAVPHVPLSHPFVERLIGTMRREFLDHVLFWNARDLERKLADFQAYYNAARSHASLEGHTPLTFAGGHAVTHADLNNVRWVSHCRDLVQLPVAA